MTLDEYFSLSRERRDEVYQVLSTPEVDARSDAMVERAETYKQRIVGVLSRMVVLLQDRRDDSNVIFLLAQLIALDQLRCDALARRPGVGTSQCKGTACCRKTLSTRLNVTFVWRQ